jgi:hypothetical protein
LLEAAVCRDHPGSKLSTKSFAGFMHRASRHLRNRQLCQRIHGFARTGRPV